MIETYIARRCAWFVILMAGMAVGCAGDESRGSGGAGPCSDAPSSSAKSSSSGAGGEGGAGGGDGIPGELDLVCEFEWTTLSGMIDGKPYSVDVFSLPRLDTLNPANLLRVSFRDVADVAKVIGGIFVDAPGVVEFHQGDLVPIEGTLESPNDDVSARPILAGSTLLLDPRGLALSIVTNGGTLVGCTR